MNFTKGAKYTVNKDEDKKSPVETLKFEMTDDNINLDADKLGEIMDAAEVASISKSKKKTKDTKDTKNTKDNKII